jgi:DNA-directed RNA polymerase subunit N (RpoN/RPB10)
MTQQQKFGYQNMTLLPIRCFSCPNVLGNKQQQYEKLLSEGKTIEEALNLMKIHRTCCRTNIMNPPAIPASLQIANDTEEIIKLYNSFNIDEKTEKSFLQPAVSTEVINLTNDPNFNTPALTGNNRPRRIFELSKKKKYIPYQSLDNGSENGNNEVKSNGEFQ